MGRILLVHIRYPEFDRCSGDVRVTNILRLLSRRNDVTLHILHQPLAYLSAAENEKYRTELRHHNIDVASGNLRRTLRREAFDAVIIEFFFVAQHLLEDIRSLQPNARIIVDTEHIYFHSDRLRAQAQGTDPNAPATLARKRAELTTYARADSIITTTNEDRVVALREIPILETFTVPNIHDLPTAATLESARRKPYSLLCIGNFLNNPANVDGLLFFCRDVLPLIRARAPHVHLNIVGNAPPPELRALQSSDVSVTGYVPEVTPYLLDAMVAICPLRFGAGLKGKIGEAMAHGLPVVTTSIGTQGMDTVPGSDIMVADSPQDFADAVIRLFEEPVLWQRLSTNGYAFVERKYSPQAVEAQIDAMIDSLGAIKVKRYAAPKRWAMKLARDATDLAERHLLWRLKRAG